MENKIFELDAIVSQMTALLKEAYDLGGKHRVNALLQAAGHSSETVAPRVRTRKNPRSSGEERGYRPGTAIANIHALLKESPQGLTTQEVVAAMTERYGSIERKTVRTSLDRLRDKWGGYISYKDGKWRPKGNIMD